MNEGETHMEKNKVKVIINNTEYTLVTPEKPEYVQRVAILVDKKIAEITEVNPHLSTAMTAMLSAINLADDFLKNEDSADNLRSQIAEYSKGNKSMESDITEKNGRIKELEKEVERLKIALAKAESAKDE